MNKTTPIAIAIEAKMAPPALTRGAQPLLLLVPPGLTFLASPAAAAPKPPLAPQRLLACLTEAGRLRPKP
jgi:hypothetical protein